MSSQITTDHQKIRRWAESRGGVPVSVEQTERDHEPGVLRIDFPGHGDEEGLRQVSWEDFFDKFDQENLAFLYQERTSEGLQSRFCKFVDRDEAESRD